MPAIHLIKKDDPARPPIIDQGAGIFSSCCWKIPLVEAQTLVEGNIYFHRRQADASFEGGIIEDVQPSDRPDRVVFTFKHDPTCVGVQPPDVWTSWEMTVVP